MNTTQPFFSSKYFNPDYLFSKETGFFHSIVNFTITPEMLFVYHVILFFLGIFFVTIIAYTMVRMFEIRAKEKKHLEHEIAEYAHHQAKKEQEERDKAGGEVSKNERWLKTLSYLFSQHASDWKLAVIEADAMLESLMADLGFRGETLGDRLKSATQDKFQNLTSAWEVHTIRNRIAHEGASFELAQREAKRIIAIYEQIFRQYGYI